MLLHVTDLSYSRVKKPADLLSIGDSKDVKIIKIDPETNRISVGVKQMFPDPYEALDKKFKVGQIVKGQVTKCVEYGAFIRIAEGLEGLCHSSEMDWTKKVSNPNKILSPSQEVSVKIIEIDKSKRRISLSYRATLENPWDKLVKDYPVGSIVNAKKLLTLQILEYLQIYRGLGLSALHHKNDITYEQKEVDLSKFKKIKLLKQK